MNEHFKKSLLLHGLVIAGFLFITLLVYYPTFFHGEKLNQHDIIQGIGESHQLKEYRSKTGEEALWNPTVFGGMPAYLSGMRFSGDLLYYAYRVLGLGMNHPTAIPFIAFVSFYILLLTYKVRPLIAAAGAIAFGLNGFNMIGIMAGHNAKIAAVALMPLVLAGINLTFSQKKWLGFVLTALALGLQIRSNHLQITYYLILIVAGFGLNQLIQSVKEKKLRDFGVRAYILVLALILAIGANFGRLYTTLEYSKYSIRGQSELSSDEKQSTGLDREYAFRYSNGIFEPLFLFVPNIYGGSSQQQLGPNSELGKSFKTAGYNRTQVDQLLQSVPTYWGDQPLTAPYYAGTLMVLLFIIAAFILPRKDKIWLLTLVVLGIMMSWGKNFAAFNDLLFDYLPGYNKFRSVTFSIIITIFSMSLLAFRGLEVLFSAKWDKELRKKVLISLGIGGGFLMALLLFSGALGFRGAIDAQLPDWYDLSALRKDRKALLTKDVLRALFYLICFVILLWAVLQKKIQSSMALFMLIMLVFTDSYLLTKRFIRKDRFEKSPVEDHFRATDADKAILQSTKPGDRVLNLQNPFNDNRTSYYHSSIGGYHGAKIRRYQDLIDYCLASEIQGAIQELQAQSLDFSSLHILNMLNTTHFYYGSERNGVFQNGSANGAAWIVEELVAVNNPDEEIIATCQLNTKTQAVIDQSKFKVSENLGQGVINLHEKTPDRIKYTASIDQGSALAVFSEIYYPKGWSAYIDGKETEIVRANYVLRALNIPEGQHEIVFEFKPKSYYLGNTVMLFSSGLIILIFVGGLARAFFQKES